MTIRGLPDHMTKYSLVKFHYFATGEGITSEVELLCNSEQKPEIEREDMETIPATTKKIFTWGKKEMEYLEWNPEFKVAFYENFGQSDWESFQNCCVEHGGYLELVKKSHYNLS